MEITIILIKKIKLAIKQRLTVATTQLKSAGSVNDTPEPEIPVPDEPAPIKEPDPEPLEPEKPDPEFIPKPPKPPEPQPAF